MHGFRRVLFKIEFIIIETDLVHPCNIYLKMEEITVQEFKRKIDSNESSVFLLDVREPFEQYQSKIDFEYSKLIPVGELQSRVDELEQHQDKEIVCLCRSGSRSAQACMILEREGFSNVKNLKGGINEWAREIDHNLPIY